MSEAAVRYMLKSALHTNMRHADCTRAAEKSRIWSGLGSKTQNDYMPGPYDSELAGAQGPAAAPPARAWVQCSMDDGSATHLEIQPHRPPTVQRLQLDGQCPHLGQGTPGGLCKSVHTWENIHIRAGPRVWGPHTAVSHSPSHATLPG